MTEPALPPLLAHLVDTARGEQPPTDLRSRIHSRVGARERFPLRVLAFAVGAAAAAFGVILWIERPPRPPVMLQPERTALRESVPEEPLPVTERSLEAEPREVPSSVPSTLPPANSRPQPLTLQRELALLGEARAALAAGEPQRALLVLERHAALGKVMGARSQLHAEARVLRLEALSGTGQGARAAEEAREFVRTHPTSPLVDAAMRFIEPETSPADSAENPDHERTPP
jgi:hypothetical protein